MDSLRQFLQNGLEAGPVHLVPWESAYVIVLVLLLSRILHSFLFKPVLAVLDERARLLAQAAGSQEETSRLLEQKAAEHSERLGHAWREAGATVETARQEAEAVTQARMQEARAAAERRIVEASSLLAAEARAAEAEVRKSTRELARRMAATLIGREVA